MYQISATKVTQNKSQAFPDPPGGSRLWVRPRFIRRTASLPTYLNRRPPCSFSVRSAPLWFNSVRPSFGTRSQRSSAILSLNINRRPPRFRLAALALGVLPPPTRTRALAGVRLWSVPPVAFALRERAALGRSCAISAATRPASDPCRTLAISFSCGL